jgi:transposase
VLRGEGGDLLIWDRFMPGFDLTLEPERPARRIEVITGGGGRRRWSADDKARVVEETLKPGAVVSEVARRHGLRPQQVFGWRREARIDRNAGVAVRGAFVPAIVEAPPPEPVPVQVKQVARRRHPGVRANGEIEVKIDSVVVRIGSGANPQAIAAVIGALKAGS